MRILVALLLFLPLCVRAEDLSGFGGVVISSGYAYASKAGNEGGLDLHGCILMFNGSVESYDTSHEIEDKHIAARIYAGLGCGPIFQVQGGIGNGGPSIRIRSNINIYALFDDRFKLETYPWVGFRSGNRNEMRNTPVVSVFAEGLRGEVRGGILIGLLLW